MVILNSEQKVWLEQHPGHTLFKITNMFNKTFNTNYARQTLNKFYTPASCIKHPIGYILYTYSKGRKRAYIKVNTTGTFIKDWEDASKYYYKLYYNQEPEYVIHLNGNTFDFSKENLYNISRKIAGKLRTYAINHGIDVHGHGIYTKTFIELLETEDYL